MSLHDIPPFPRWSLIAAVVGGVVLVANGIGAVDYISRLDAFPLATKSVMREEIAFEVKKRDTELIADRLVVKTAADAVTGQLNILGGAINDVQNALKGMRSMLINDRVARLRFQLQQMQNAIILMKSQLDGTPKDIQLRLRIQELSSQIADAQDELQTAQCEQRGKTC